MKSVGVSGTWVVGVAGSQRTQTAAVPVSTFPGCSQGQGTLRVFACSTGSWRCSRWHWQGSFSQPVLQRDHAYLPHPREKGLRFPSRCWDVWGREHRPVSHLFCLCLFYISDPGIKQLSCPGPDHLHQFIGPADRGGFLFWFCGLVFFACCINFKYPQALTCQGGTKENLITSFL